MTASEARENSQKTNIDIFNSQYVDIISKITEASNKGEYSVFYYKDIKSDVSKKLEQDGYTITNQYDRDSMLFKICW